MDMERKVLHWSYHNLRELPQELSEDLKEVEDLYLKENFIPSLPKWFFAVQSIRFLQLSGNLLEEIPPEIGKLTQLDFLDVSKNSLTSLPESIGLLTRLERLYLSENPMRRLPRAIGRLAKLRIFECCRTLISYIPLSLSQCVALEEVNLNDNQCLYEVPAKLLSLPKLGYIYVDRCNLFYLPCLLNTKTLKHVRLFENDNLTHYPLAYEPFIPPMLHFSSPLKLLFQLNNGLPQVYVTNEKCVLNLPRTIVTLLSCTSRTPLSLVEQTYRVLHNYLLANNDQLFELIEPHIPQTIFERLQHGPTACCGNSNCEKPLFRECCFIVVRRLKKNQQYLFTQMFCSKDCTEAWTLHNMENYKCIWWS